MSKTMMWVVGGAAALVALSIATGKGPFGRVFGIEPRSIASGGLMSGRPTQTAQAVVATTPKPDVWSLAQAAVLQAGSIFNSYLNPVAAEKKG